MAKSALAQKIADLELTQLQFARIMGVSHQSVQIWIHGLHAPSLRAVIRMAKVLKLSMDETIQLLADSGHKGMDALPLTEEEQATVRTKAVQQRRRREEKGD